MLKPFGKFKYKGNPFNWCNISIKHIRNIMVFYSKYANLGMCYFKNKNTKENLQFSSFEDTLMFI